MTALFQVNFRREAYLKEVARTRRRVTALAIWVAYFGVVAVVLGLYGLNCAAVGRRAQMLERQTARLRASQSSPDRWQVGPTELAQVERYVMNPRRWRDRLVRLAALVPPDMALTSVAMNPENTSSARAQNALVITGVLRPSQEQDRMAGVMRFVSALHRDTTFAAGYRTIKLSSSRISQTPPPAVEFVIECR